MIKARTLPCGPWNFCRACSPAVNRIPFYDTRIGVLSQSAKQKYKYGFGGCRTLMQAEHPWEAPAWWKTSRSFERAADYWCRRLPGRRENKEGGCHAASNRSAFVSLFDIFIIHQQACNVNNAK